MVVESARVRRGAKLGAGVILTKSTRVFDTETGGEPPRGAAPADRPRPDLSARRALGHPPTEADVELLVRTVLSDWDRTVRHLPGLADMVAELATMYRLAIVTNAQDDVLVAAHLKAMGIRDHFDAVVTSLDVGWRKPQPKIYAAVLRQLQIDPAAAVFIGDTYAADCQGPTQSGIN
jgi:putative hydrolase of the HAD superfamily